MQASDLREFWTLGKLSLAPFRPVDCQIGDVLSLVHFQVLSIVGFTRQRLVLELGGG